MRTRIGGYTLSARAAALAAIFVVTLACTAPIAATPGAAVLPGPNNQAASGAENPDVIFHNGIVLTMDAANTQAQALAIKDGKITAVGDEAAIVGLKGSATRMADLGGLTLMPGFIDAHNHLLQDGSKKGDIDAAQQLALENGVTTTGEMFVDEPLLKELQAYGKAGKMRIRTGMYLAWNNSCGDILGDWYKLYQPNQRYGRLRVNGVKIFSDGGACNVPAVSFTYAAPGLGSGNLYMTSDELAKVIAEADAAGYQVAVHALGDRGVETTLNAYQTVLAGQPNTKRHRIEHAAIVRPDMLPRFDQIGTMITIFGAFPTCAYTGQSGVHLKFITPEQDQTWESPWRDILAANPKLHAAYYSDYPSFTINPILGLYGFVTRQQVGGDGTICKPTPGLAAGTITVQQALRAMTYEGAYVLRMEDSVGSLEVGKFADMVILSDNPLTVDPQSLKDLQVRMTMVSGKVEYCAPGSDALCPPGSP